MTQLIGRAEIAPALLSDDEPWKSAGVAPESWFNENVRGFIHHPIDIIEKSGFI